MRMTLLALTAIAALSSGAASGQTRYFARERLAAGQSSNQTSTPKQTYTATCGARQGGMWAKDYQAREIAGQMKILGDDGGNQTGSTATALCKAHVEATGKTGVCSTNFTVYFYEGDTTLQSTFASNYSIVCTATPK